MSEDSKGYFRWKETGRYERLRRSSQPVVPLHAGKNADGGKGGPVEVPVDRTLTCRYELKYLIDESKAHAVEQFIRPYLHIDRYCTTRPSGLYPVVTLYLDSDDFKLCRQSLEGQKNRFKLRIRSYTDELDYPRFVEIKRRINNIIVKSRARVMDEELAAVVSGISLPETRYAGDQETLKQFQLYCRGIGAQPVLKLRYTRRAYEGDTENRVRITFDRDMAYRICNKPDLTLNGTGWQHCNMSTVILEIKFTGCYPAWLGRMAKCLDLRQWSVSKYVYSIKHCELMGFLFV
jgi:hypothetical protein